MPYNLARARVLYERAVEEAERLEPGVRWRHWDKLMPDEQQLWVDALTRTEDEGRFIPPVDPSVDPSVEQNGA